MPLGDAIGMLADSASGRPGDGQKVLAVEADMPFKSRAQRRKFAQLLVEGKISNETFEEWNRETGRKKLPERVARKVSARKKPQTKGRKRTASKRRR
jgi:hypothetical protein